MVLTVRLPSACPGGWRSLPTAPLLWPTRMGVSSAGIVPGRGGSGSEAIPLANFEALPRVPGVRVSVFAGGGQGFVDASGRQARFVLPQGLALDGSGNVIVADDLNHAIRAIAPDGTVTTIAGGNGRGARDGPCEEAQFAKPAGVAVDADGSIYVADSDGNRIRRIDTDTVCSVTTVAGRGGGLIPGGRLGRLPRWACRRGGVPPA